MGRSIRILHVDDDPELAEMAAVFLEREDERFDVETAANASEGIDRLEEAAFDCVVSDYEMPGRNGIEFLEAVREEFPDLPLILFTGRGSEAVASDAISAGVTDYLQKGSGTSQYAVLANKIRNAVRQHRTRQALLEEQDRHAALFNSFPEPTVAIAIVDGTPVIRDVNPAFESTFGYDAETAVGEPINDLIVPDGQHETAQQIDDRARNGDLVDQKVRRVTVNGTRDFLLWSVPVDGDADYYAVYEDVTERKRHEQKLTALHDVADDLMECETARHVFEQTVNASEDILDFDMSVAAMERDGVLVPVATSAELSSETVVEMSVDEGLSGKTYRTGDSFLIDDLDACEEADPQGPYSSALSVPVGDHGNFQAVVEAGSAFDEHDLELVELLVKHAESALDRLDRQRELERQNERLEQFTSVASHDLRNPLNVAQGRLELAQSDCDSEHLEPAAAAVDRSLSLLEELLTVAREGERVTDFEPVDLASTVRQCWETVNADDDRVVIETDRAIRADRSRLRQLLENFLRNAVEHGSTSPRSPEAPEDAVEYGSTSPATHSRQEGAADDSDGLRVVVGDTADGFYVADTGPGIPEEDREYVFDAGYTTRERGTGLGLNIVAEVARAHDWTVDVGESERGGARFDITGVETVED